MKERELTPEAEAERADFNHIYGGTGCTCFLCAPCSCCTHPGNPANQAEDPGSWGTKEEE